MYERDGKVYMQHTGTRSQVYAGIAFATAKGSAGLTKDELHLYENMILSDREYEAAIKKSQRPARGSRCLTKKCGNRQEVYLGKALMTPGRIERKNLRMIGDIIYTVNELVAMGLPVPPLPPLEQDDKPNPHLPPRIPPTEEQALANSVPANDLLLPAQAFKCDNPQKTDKERNEERTKTEDLLAGSSETISTKTPTPQAPDVEPPWKPIQMVNDFVNPLPHFLHKLQGLSSGDAHIGMTVAIDNKLYLISGQRLE